jgi:hypothetical protein
VRPIVLQSAFTRKIDILRRAASHVTEDPNCGFASYMRKLILQTEAKSRLGRGLRRINLASKSKGKSLEPNF